MQPQTDFIKIWYTGALSVSKCCGIF